MILLWVRSLPSNSGQVKVNRDPPLNMDVPVQKHDQMVQFPDVILHRKKFIYTSERE